MDPLYLTKGQCKYLGGLVDASHADAPWEPDDTVIFSKSDDGWIFVMNAEDLKENDEAGVWVDANGSEQHGPTGR